VSADNVKWQVNKAVRASNLPSAARLVMLVLSDMAEVKGGYIPAKHSPSLADLAHQTGLGESTVKAQLTVLEELGWVRRTRPSGAERARHQQTYYQLAVGLPGEERPALKRKPRARSKPSEETFEGQEQAIAEGQDIALEEGPETESEGQELADRGPGASSSRARSKPSYLKDDDLDDQYDQKASADAAAEGDAEAKPKRPRKPRDAKPKAEPDPAVAERHHLAEEIVRWWWNELEIKPAGKNAWFASVATIEALLKVGWVPRDVAKALRAAGKPVTIARLEIELEKHGKRQNGSGTGKGSNDQYLAAEMEWALQMEAEEAARQQQDTFEEIPT
jgi:hypothetical protein